jgi:hypothetical protein
MGRGHHAVFPDRCALESGGRQCLVQIGRDIPHRTFDVVVLFAGRHDMVQSTLRRFDTLQAGDHPRRELGRRDTAASGCDVALGEQWMIDRAPRRRPPEPRVWRSSRCCCSCRRRFACGYQNHFVTVTVSVRTPPLPAADADHEHNMFTVNADALVRPTRAVLPAIGSTSVSGSPSTYRRPTVRTRAAVCPRVRGLRPNRWLR